MNTIINNTLQYYQDNAKNLAQRYESADVRNIHDLLVKTFSTNGLLLELGCGSGRDASFLSKNNFKITAIDASCEMIAEAKKIHPEISKSLYVKSIPDGLDFKNETFDGIYSIATLMHLTQNSIQKTMKKVHSLLKYGGIFLFSVSIERDDIDEHEEDVNRRLFTTMPKDRWIDLCATQGFQLLDQMISGDGLDRSGIVWLTCKFKKV
jgi:SAM-dependent methyltransferase